MAEIFAVFFLFSAEWESNKCLNAALFGKMNFLLRFPDLQSVC